MQSRSVYLLFISLLCYFNLSAQSRLSQKEHDFGDIYANTRRYVDITIENNSNRGIYVLRVEQSPNVVYKLSSDLIAGGGSATLRVQVNPKNTGRFQLGCNVFLSDQDLPLTFTITGDVKELERTTASTTACPDFNSTPVFKASSELTIITVDKVTRTPLSKSKVVIIRNGEPAGAWITGKKGAFNASIPSGYFYFLATHEGYLNNEAGVYVGPEISEITIPLAKTDEIVPQQPLDTLIADEAEELTPEQATEILEEAIASVDTVQVTNPELSELEPDNFNESLFKPVNIEFVIDISSSMKQNDKMELMKYSLNHLVGELRSVDRMGIVTYADNAKVFQEPTLCDRKEEILNAVSKLSPMGLTAGGKGIKLGYRELMQNYDPTKTNMIIVITDGAFNKDSDDYQKVVRKYAKKGIVFSVVGVHANSNDVRRMTEAATFGNGRFIPINKLSEAQNNLFQEIRTASYKGKI